MDYYKFIKLIGKGAFGKVLLGIHKLTDKYVAIKSIHKDYMKDEFSKRKVFQEVYILKKIRHANVIRLLEVFEDSKQLFIVMEYARHGDLLNYVKKKHHLAESEARKIFKQIVFGLGHIHSRGVLHRDIKLDNILLDTDFHVKICDFGVSKIITRSEIIREQCGTPAYIAPEIIVNKGYKGFYIDHWSLGIVLYAILCGSIPFKASNMDELLKVIKTTHITFPASISEEAKDLIKHLLVINPKDRLSIPGILNHPWLKGKEDCVMGYKECINLEVNELVPNINVVNVSNLFFNKDERLSYRNYCYICNDLYTQYIGKQLINK